MRSDVCPRNSHLMMQNHFFIIKMAFLTYNYTSFVFQPILTKRKIFLSLIFYDLSFEK